MATEEVHTLVLTKLAERQLQPKVIEKNYTGVIVGVNNRSLSVQGYSVELNTDEGFANRGWKQLEDFSGNAVWKYEYYLRVVYSTRSDKQADKAVLNGIYRSIYTKSAQPVLGKWTLSSVDGVEYEVPDESAIRLSDDFIGYTEVSIPDDYEERFNHLFGLDAHVGRIKRALEAGLLSDWQHRLHCALIGPPGCGKSDICRTIKSMLGEEAVLEFDATATTAAGAIKELAEREILPRIVIIEEAEKADDKALDFLLAALDLRAEIRKTTARATIQRDTKLFAIATVNNYDLFTRLKAGALASRFSQKIFFGRPNRDQLEMILQREITKVDGDFAWIGPTLDYADKVDMTDPRAVISICMCGRDMLVTGEYQEMLEATSESLPVSGGGFENWSAA
jgi:ATPase family associated with various cellular activities (AAA)